jgi:TonB family protein
LTAASGLQTDAAWSPSGEAIAYASDQTGNFDIWIQRVDGSGEPKQITSEPDDEWQPDWSPDGKALVFRSERDGGGLFIANVEGGGARRLTTFGYHPRWSPDARRILFASAQTLVMGQRQQFYVVAVAGGEPHQVSPTVAEDFVTIPEICWHPDGQRITIAGIDEKHRVLVRTLAVDTEKVPQVAIDWTKSADNPVYDIDGVMWSRSGDALFLVGKDFGGAHVWRLSLDRQTGQRRGSPEEIISRSLSDREIVPAPDGTRAAFTLAHRVTRLWKYPVDGAEARVIGPGRAITAVNGSAYAPDFTKDGKKLSYVFIPDPEPGQTFRRELHEYTEAADRTLLADAAMRFAPRWSHDGRYLSYRWTPPDGRVFVATVLDTVTLREQQLTSPQEFATPFGWTVDDRFIATSIKQGDPPREGLFRVPSAVEKHRSAPVPIAADRKYDIWQGTYSPDGRWIAFVVQEPTARWSTILVMPSSGGAPIQITDGRGWDDKPRWASDGRLLYFVTSRGAPFAVGAIRIDPATGKPVGPALQVISFHAPRQQVLSDVAWMEMAVARDAVALPIVETTGSVWTTSTAAAAAPTAATKDICPDRQPPEVIRRAAPVYSYEAATHKLSGTVEIEAGVDIDGTVRSVRIVRSPDARLDPEAMRAATQWIFRPARCKGEVVATTAPIHIVFERK